MENLSMNYDFVATSLLRTEERKEERRRSNSQSTHSNLNAIVLLPFLVIGSYKYEEAQCYFGSAVSKLRQNKIESRVVMLQYAANNPIEDRYKVSQLKAIDGYAMSVFDGHGGWQVAELAMKKLHDEIDRTLLLNTNKYDTQDDWVQLSLK